MRTNGIGTSAGDVVAFDFDGVLVRGDSFGRFLREHIRASWWRLVLAVLATPVALPLLLTRRGISSGAMIYVRIAHFGLSHDAFRERIRAFGADLGSQDGRMITDGLEALRAHRAAGARVVIVSGCEETLVRAILEQHGLDNVEIVASRIGPHGRHCLGGRKIDALEQAGISPPWSVAYSDSLSDLPLLRNAERPVLVNADTQMSAQAKAALGRTPENVRWR